MAAPNDVRTDFEEFCAAYAQGLTMQLYAYLGDLHEAQDAVQEAFSRADGTKFVQVGGPDRF